MDHRIRPRHQRGQCGGIGKVAAHPFDAFARALIAARQCAAGVPRRQRGIDHRMADKPGRAGDRQQAHSKTMWSRWITQDRGA